MALDALWGKPLFASIAAGLTYVGPRPLPYGERSDTIFTLDASVDFRWWIFETSIAAQNLLDTQYRLGEYNYASDFHCSRSRRWCRCASSAPAPPLTVLWSFAIHYGDRR